MSITRRISTLGMASIGLRSLSTPFPFLLDACRHERLVWSWSGRPCTVPSCWLIGNWQGSMPSLKKLPHWSNDMFLIDVVDVKPLDEHKLELSFADGLKAVIDMKQVVRSFDGVFAPLEDPEFFRQVRVDREIGTIV